MSDELLLDTHFNLSRINHHDTINEQEFRDILGPIRDERRLSTPHISPEHIRMLSSFFEPTSHTLRYPIGLDVAVAGFTHNPIEYEKFTLSTNPAEENHVYGVGPDVGIGAPNVANKSNYYDPAGAMFTYADYDHDGRINRLEFGTLMRSV